MNERSIFAAALDIADAAERATYLDQVCGDNADLRRRLDELLAAQEKLGSFLARPLALPQATTDGEPLSERPGTVIGPYKLMEQIGEGGMGLVFVAEQQQPMRRRVALKLIKPGMDTRDVIARFEAERQALALMDHPNIAKVLDAGATDSGRPYFVMELVKGVPITDYCEQNQLAPRERLGLFVSVCQAVQHAHAKGIIHRDLKPSNVLVTLHDGTPVVKVIDFGVAKAVGQHLTDKTVYTRFAQMIGTPLYMSPEQAEMSGLDIDTRSDIYSLCVLLYELLTGTTPFDKERLQKAAFDEVRRIIREEEPPPPSTRLTSLGGELTAASAGRKSELGKLSALVRGELDWIVMKGLDKDRTRRYETASALAQDIRHYLADEPVLAGPPSAGYRLRKFVKRRRGPVLAAGLVLLAVLAGIVGTSLGWVEALSQRDDAVRARAEEVEQRRAALAAEVDAKKSEQLARDSEKVAQEERHRALFEKQEAELARKTAEANETRAEWRLYASNLASAQREWDAGNDALFHHYLAQCHPDFRGWEHDLLYTLANQNQQTLGRHTGEDLEWPWYERRVHYVAFSPDGKRLASASGDGTVKVWDAASGQEMLTLKGHAGHVNSVAYSPDGKRLASASYDKTVKVWDLTSGKAVLTLKGHPDVNSGVATNGVLSVAFSPDGKRLASASNDRTVKVWDAASGLEILTLKGHTGAVTSVAFSPDGKRLASASWDNRVKVWDAASGQEILTLRGHTLWVTSVAFSPDGKRLASASRDGTVKVWDADKGQEIMTLKGHTGRINSVAFSPDGKRLASAAENEKVVKLWDADNGQEILVAFRGHTGGVSGVAFSPDGKRLASASNDGTVKLWDPEGTQGGGLTLQTGGSVNVAFSPDGKWLAGASKEQKVRLWDAVSGQEVPTFKEHTDYVESVAFSPDGKRLAGISPGGGRRGGPFTVKVWDTASGKVLLTFRGHTEDAIGVAFSPDGKRLATVTQVNDSQLKSLDSSQKVWDAASGQEVLTLKGDTGRVSGVVFSPDGKRLATAADDGTVKLWDAASGKEILHMKAHTQGVSRVAFSPDGKRLASASYDRTVKVWDADKGQEILTLKGHTNRVNSMAFSPDGKRLATASSDRTVKVWDAASGQEVLTLREHAGAVLSVAFSPDGKRLASTDGTTIKMWDASRSLKEAGQK